MSEVRQVMPEGIIPIKVAPKVNECLVKHLESLIEKAKEGEIIGITSACMWTGGEVSVGWVLPDGGTSLIPLVGELDVLRHLLINVEVDKENRKGHSFSPI